MSNLNNYSIYELRKIARDCGVQSPTTKKRAQLISQIEQIKSKQLKPYYSTKGRPAKNLLLAKGLNDNNIIINKNDIKSIIATLQSVQDSLSKYL